MLGLFKPKPPATQVDSEPLKHVLNYCAQQNYGVCLDAPAQWIVLEYKTQNYAVLQTLDSLIALFQSSPLTVQDVESTLGWLLAVKLPSRLEEQQSILAHCNENAVLIQQALYRLELFGSLLQLHQ